MTRPSRMAAALAVLAAGVLAGCGSGRDAAGPGQRAGDARFQAQVRWTRYGLPHVKAADYAGLGYGYGYAVARDRLCLLADRIVTLRGQRSARFGTEAKALVGFMELPNADSDLFYRVQLSDAEVEAAWQGLSADARALAEGYAAGFNRYLRDMPAESRAAACGAGAPPQMQASDVVRAVLQIGLWEAFLVAPFASSSQWEALDPAASAPAAAAAAATATADEGTAAAGPPAGGASNAWAYGADVTGTGASIVVANPHTFWQDHWLLMHQMHLTIPGEIDVMGADFIGLPVPLAGFTRDVAWSIEAPATVTYPMLIALDLQAGPEPSYAVDGQVRALQRRQVEIEALRADGTVDVRTHSLPYSHLGPVYRLPAAPGRPAGWYAVTSPSRGNALLLDQMLATAKARDIGELERAVAGHRGGTAHVIAGDRHGQALYVESGPLLDLDEATLRACALEFREGRLPAALDGRRGACAIRHPDGRARLAPAERIPALATRGAVHNANDSYAHSLFGRHLAGYSRLLGDPDQQPNPRTRMSQRRIAEYLARDGRIGVEQAVELLFDNRSLVAETALDGILAAACRDPDGAGADVARACGILAGWDRRYDGGSRGALLFHELWPRLEDIDGLYAAPYDPEQPFRERPISRTPAAAAAIRTAIAGTMRALAALGLQGDEPWGEMLARPTRAGRVALHGGPGGQGVLNVMVPGALGREGYADIVSGAAYMHVVTWEGGRPVAQVLVAHGQTSDPASPWRDDQLPLFAAKRFFTPPFDEKEIAGDPALEVMELRE